MSGDYDFGGAFALAFALFAAWGFAFGCLLIGLIWWVT